MTHSIIKKTQLKRALRLDAEYYQPGFLKLIENLKKLGAVPLRQIAINPKRKFSPKNDVYFDYIEISAINLNTGEYNKSRIIGSESPDRAQWIVGKNDVIVSTVRPIRNAVSLIDKKNQNLVCSSGFAVLKPTKIEPEYLFAYLKSQPIINLLNRQTIATMYPAVTIEDVLNIPVYLGKVNFRKTIQQLVILSQEELENSKKFYHQAEEMLLEELGLMNFESKNDLVSIVKLSEVKNANRIDAEYFQAKYKKLVEKMKKHNCKRFEELIKSYSTGYPFQSSNYLENGIPLIRINNIKKSGIDLSDTAYLSENDHKLSKKDIATAGDIVLSMSGSIGLTAKIPVGIPKCSINQRILKFTPKNIETDFLVLVLNSIVGKLQLDRIGTGGLQTNISYKDIKNILIPILPDHTQQKIAELVQKSHSARQKSKELLDEAKNKVEKLIEKSN